jgi:transglutaminase-like putative cysteine protease
MGRRVTMLGALLALGATGPLSSAQDRARTEPFAGRRAGEFQVEAQIEIPPGSQSLELWIPAPRVDETQSVLESAAPTPQGGTLTQQTDREHGNTFLHLKMAYPKGTIRFTASWKFERRESAKQPFRRGARRLPTPVEEQALARDLAPAELAPVAGRMRVRADTIVGAESDPLNAARALYEDVIRSVVIEAGGPGRRRGDALFALDAGRGDAFDVVALFVGLARARGIPARAILGFPLPEVRQDAPAEVPAATAWAEFFVPDLGWIPVDLATAKNRPEQRQYCFGALDERRIQFTEGRQVRLAPPSRRAVHDDIIYPYSEVDGEPTAVTFRSIFKEK